MICLGLNVYFATFFSRKTITALDPYWLRFSHLTTLGLSLSEKTRKSNRLQMSLQRHHFLFSYLKDPHLSVGPACGVLNQRPPAQRTGAYPTELTGWQKGPVI